MNSFTYYSVVLFMRMLSNHKTKHFILCAVFIILFNYQSGYSYFVKYGPCLFPRKITCPDPHINFQLYTNANREVPQKIDSDVNTILRSNFNLVKENKFIIHGYNKDIYTPELQDIKESYLTRGGYNVWMVDWKAVAKGPCFVVVLSSLNHVGACVAEFLQRVREATISPSYHLFHVIGFSLGAHIAAYTANHLKPDVLPRITGLDPALTFTPMDFTRKLQPTDAHFVDVLHTDALGKGTLKRCGHVDFYMNGGLKQPGCRRRNFLKTISCNHRRAASYFAESITSDVGFWGYPCQSLVHYLLNKCPPTTPTVLMGEHINYDVTGVYVYIVQTEAQKPFARGRDIIQSKHND